MPSQAPNPEFVTSTPQASGSEKIAPREPAMKTSQLFERAKEWALGKARKQRQEEDHLRETIALAELQVKDLELEAGVKPSEKTRCQQLVREYAEELRVQYGDHIKTNPELIASNTVIVDNRIFGRWQALLGEFPCIYGFASIHERNNTRVLILPESFFESPWGRDLVRHEVMHLSMSENCPEGLAEGGAQYYATQKTENGEPENIKELDLNSQGKGSLRTIAEYLKMPLGFKRMYLETRAQRALEYNLGRTIYENLVHAVGEEAMEDIFFDGNQQGLDRVPPAIRTLTNLTIKTLNKAESTREHFPLYSMYIAEAYAASKTARILNERKSDISPKEGGENI
ncbi:hypothetical protein KKB83_00975 [Patescibacteria group bacterium]|nr:hypothetical protein [Patescibacteria group bacterium]